MPRRFRSKRLRQIAILPALLTLGNLVCGFAAINFVMKHMMGANVFTTGHGPVERWLPSNLAIAAYLLFAAMAFDALDGRVARLTRKTSDFGAAAGLSGGYRQFRCRAGISAARAGW